MGKRDKWFYTEHQSTPLELMSTQIENQDMDHVHFEQRLPQIYRSIIAQFRKIATSFALFKGIFYALFALEALALTLFLPLVPSMIALSLCGLFLTVFAYFVLLFYFQAKKPEQLSLLKDHLLSSLRRLSGAKEEHSAIASALTKLSTYLDLFEENFYRAPAWLKPLHRVATSFSTLCHWQDVFRFKQMLLHSAIEEYIAEVQAAPTDLEVHASLAGVYVLLSKLYREAAAMKGKHSPSIESQETAAAKLALEEYHILNHFAPGDPWVHEQLIAGYHRLGKTEEEIRHIELLMKLRPHDADLYLKLGVLYFKEGRHAKGLCLYEELKSLNYKKAEELIASYSSQSQALVIL